MLLHYRDPHFWEKFEKQYWRPRVPTVIRRPFKEFPFSESMILRGMREFEAGLRSGDERFRCIFSLGDSHKSPRRPLRALFRGESASMDQLEENCARLFPKQAFGLMVNNLQSIDPGIWIGVTAFLQDFHRSIECPVAKSVVDLFFGNYASSFLGLHKDTQEIFAFVVRGEKTILAWPFDYFLKRIKGISSAARFFQMNLPVDYRKYRRDAIVLHARPGDVIFWPSDYWHIAQGRPGDFSAMLSLGIFRPDIVRPEQEKELSDFRKRLLSGNAPGMRSQQVPKVSDPAQLRRTTAFGFRLGAPLLEDLSDRPLKVAKKDSSLLLWKVGGRRIEVSANGHTLRLPHSQRTLVLLKRLARGQTVSAASEPRLIDWLERVRAVE